MHPPASRERFGRLTRYASASFGTQMMLATVTAFVPPALEKRGANAAMIALLLAIGPAAGLTVQTLASIASDRIDTRFGRRVPFILAGAPITALALSMLGRAGSLAAAAGFLALAFIALNLYAGPYRASLNEEIAQADQPLAMGIGAALKGAGTLLAFTCGAALLRSRPEGPFDLVAAGVIVSALVSARAMRARSSIAPAARPSLFASLGRAPTIRWLLAAHFAWWFALHGVFAFIVLFAVHDLRGVTDVASAEGRAATSDSAGVLAVFAVAAMLAAVPVGRLAQRIGKERTLFAGLVLLLLGLGSIALTRSFAAMFPLAALSGAGFAVIQVIPFPLVIAFGPRGHDGAVAGLFNGIIELAQLASLATMGGIIEWAGSYRAPFVIAVVALLGAIALLGRGLIEDRRENGDRPGVG